MFYNSSLQPDHLGIFCQASPAQAQRDTVQHYTILYFTVLSCSISSTKYPVCISVSLTPHTQYFWSARSRHHHQSHPPSPTPPTDIGGETAGPSPGQVHQVHRGRGAGVAEAGLHAGGGEGGAGGSSYLLTWNDLGWGAAHHILRVLSTIWLEFLQGFRWSNTSGGNDNNRKIHNLRTLCFQEIEERKNLLNQFRKWKKRKRKTFNIVVTERSRREMAEQEEEKNKKRIPPQK